MGRRETQKDHLRGSCKGEDRVNRTERSQEESDWGWETPVSQVHMDSDTESPAPGCSMPAIPASRGRHSRTLRACPQHTPDSVKDTAQKTKTAGQTDQWLRALAALTEDSDSIPSTCMRAHNMLEFHFQGI